MRGTARGAARMMEKRSTRRDKERMEKRRELLRGLFLGASLDVRTLTRGAFASWWQDGTVEGKLLLRLRMICGVQRILGQQLSHGSPESTDARAAQWNRCCLTAPGDKRGLMFMILNVLKFMRWMSANCSNKRVTRKETRQRSGTETPRSDLPHN